MRKDIEVKRSEDDEKGEEIGCVGGKNKKGIIEGGKKRRFKKNVLRRIEGNEKLSKKDKIGMNNWRLGEGSKWFGKI